MLVQWESQLQNMLPGGSTVSLRSIPTLHVRVPLFYPLVFRSSTLLREVSQTPALSLEQVFKETKESEGQSMASRGSSH